ncbi:MAG TPA: alpha-L-rhamnosidase C-terminal domain-containing protein [Jatrophihabitans sp.]|nr:alpha-L-rhamnosidase C-terminal domain-containing protein [Jatrophihabitans sp.]
MPVHLRRSATLAAVAAAALALAPAAPDAAAAPSNLGLPSLADAQQYNLAPATRTLRPVAVAESWGTDSDYVTAAQSVSETDGHNLQTGPESSTANTDGVTVRQAGPGDPGAWFSYRLHVPARGGLTLRVEEAGAQDVRYDVLVNGTQVYRRTPDANQSGTWHDMVGLVHYEVAVPNKVVGSAATATVTFRNAANPGPGARIAGVWALSAQPAPPSDPPYGGSVANPSGALGSGTTTLSTNLFGKPYVIYDFGKEVGGTASLAANVTDGAPKLGLAFSETTQFMTTASDFSQDPPGIATETHYFPLVSGKQAVDDPVIRGGFRYLMVFLDSPGTASVSNLQLHFTADPTNEHLRDYRGAFLSSDDTLNRLWYAGAYTVQMDSIDPTTGRPYPAQPGPVHNDATIGDGASVISDGAKRDRLIWGGDNAVSAPVSYVSTGEADPARNAIAFMAKGAFPSGQVAGVYLPTGGYQAGWGEYAAWWIQNYWTHYLYTGDRTFLDTYWPTLTGDVAWFESLVGTDGLLNIPGGASGHWGYGNAGEETYDNALYVHVLSMAAQAADVQGSPLAADYRAHATRTSDAINAQLWDADAGAYVEKPGDTAHPQDGNAMAVLAGVATADRAASVLRYFATQLATPVGDLTNDATSDAVPRYVSPFVTAQELGAYAAQHSDAADQAAMSLLRRTWVHMLGGALPGTMWENVSPTGGLQLGSYTSLSHGWAAAPTTYLTNDVLGVTPTSAGFATFQVLPHPSGGPTWAEGRVPTPHGDITAAWKRSATSFQLTVSAPAGTTGTVGVPAAGVSQLSVDGSVVWQQGAAQQSGVATHDGYLEVAGVSGSTTLQATLG